MENLKENVATSVEEVMTEMKKAEGLSLLKVFEMFNHVMFVHTLTYEVVIFLLETIIYKDGQGTKSHSNSIVTNLLF